MKNQFGRRVRIVIDDATIIDVASKLDGETTLTLSQQTSEVHIPLSFSGEELTKAIALLKEHFEPKEPKPPPTAHPPASIQKILGIGVPATLPPSATPQSRAQEKMGQ